MFFELSLHQLKLSDFQFSKDVLLLKVLDYINPIWERRHNLLYYRGSKSNLYLNSPVKRETRYLNTVDSKFDVFFEALNEFARVLALYTKYINGFFSNKSFILCRYHSNVLSIPI